MPPPDDVSLGTRTKDLLARSTWSHAYPYPAHQAWADDCEQLLAFLDAQGVFDQLLPRLSANEWEGAFAEVRAAYYLKFGEAQFGAQARAGRLPHMRAVHFYGFPREGNVVVSLTAPMRSFALGVTRTH